MSQVIDRIVGANPTGFDMRTELNNIIGALESDNSGSSEPLNPVAYMKWLDTSNATYYYYKERNHDNTAWVTLFRYTVSTKVMEAVSNGIVLNDVVVHKTGDETIGGTKTFSSSPVVPNAITITQAVNKGQLDTKQDTLVSGTNIKTINSNSILGSGDIVVGETAWTANDSRAKTALNATGEAPIYACRAWVNFNGTGTVAIRASGNVSSITDNGTGDYTVNFATAMPDKLFSTSVSCTEDYSNNPIGFAIGNRSRFDITTSSVRVMSFVSTTGSKFDAIEYSVQIHR